MIHRDLLRKNAQTIIDDEINPDKDIEDLPTEVYLAMKHLARDINPRVVIELLDTLEQAEREAAHFKALAQTQTDSARILLKAFGNSQDRLSDAGWALNMDRQGGA